MFCTILAFVLLIYVFVIMFIDAHVFCFLQLFFCNILFFVTCYKYTLEIVFSISKSVFKMLVFIVLVIVIKSDSKEGNSTEFLTMIFFV